MKVESKRSSGRPAFITAGVHIALAAAILAGAGVAPMWVASAQVAEAGPESALAGVTTLPPAEESPKAEDLREPSGLEDVAAAAGTRKPTVIKPRPAVRKPAVAKPRPAVRKPAVAKPRPAVRKAAPAAGPSRAAAPASAPSEAGWKSARASWYGPGLYGNTMAGGGTLTQSSMVVAHRTLPFGTRIEFSYRGKTAVAVVQDRGPHIAGRVFDLGPGIAKALGFSGVDTVRYRILSQ